MLEVHFNELVEELEISAADDQRGYRVKVALLAALGYVYVIAAVALLMAVAYLIVRHAGHRGEVGLFLLAFPFVMLSVIAVRALWVSMPPPEGTVVTARQAPQLFALLEKIRRKLDGPPIHQVLIDDEFNAAIMQLPRFGLFGGTRNYVVIGLPLMQTLGLEQFAAVMAHEYGHLSAAHGEFSAWICRLRMTWCRILQRIQERPMRGSGVFVHFFRWYVPYFQAYTFVLARANEYEADCAAARVAGARNTADALLTVEVTGRFMEERFWSTFMGGADKSPAPSFLPYTQLPLSLNVGLDEGDGQAWLKAALLRKTGMDDTHPSLKDRLAALGEPPRLPPRRITSAAKVLLGEHMEAVVREFDHAWGKRNLREWGERYKEAQELKARAAVISAKAKSGSTLSAEDWTAFGEACLRFGGKEKAIGHFHKALEISPDHAEAHMAIAEVLLERRDAAALGHLDSAIAKGDADMAWSASVLAARFMREAGRPRDAERYERKLTAQHAQAREKEVHRVVLMDDDALAPQDLSAEDAKHCRAAFKRIPRLRSVRAFCKVMPGAGELHLVFVVEGKLDPVRMAMQVFWRLTGISESEDPLADQVVDALPLKRPFTVFNEDYLAPAVQGMVWRLEDSVIYKAP